MHENDLLIQLGQQIRRFRKEARLTQQQLADRAETGLETVGNLERGENFTSLTTLFRISRVLGRNLEELFEWAPRVKRRPDLDAMDAAVARLKELMSSGEPIDLEQASALLLMLAKANPKPEKRRR